MAGEGWELLLGERCQHIPVSLPLVFVPFNTPQMYPCLPGGVCRVDVNQLKLKLVTSYESFILDVSELGASGRGGRLHPKAALRNDSGCAGRRVRGLLVPGAGQGNQCPPGSVGSVQVLTSPGGTQASDLQLWHLQLSLPGRVRIRSCSFALGQNAESGQPRALQEAHSLLSPLSRLPPAESFAEPDRSPNHAGHGSGRRS